MVNGAEARCKSFFVEAANIFQVFEELRFEEFESHGDAIFVPLAFADEQFVADEVEASLRSRPNGRKGRRSSRPALRSASRCG